MKCVVVIRYGYSYALVKDESKRREAINKFLLPAHARIGWSEDIDLVSLPGKFSLHGTDHRNRTISFRQEGISEQTNFHTQVGTAIKFSICSGIAASPKCLPARGVRKANSNVHGFTSCLDLILFGSIMTLCFL